jgi:hypothetical protein
MQQMEGWLRVQGQDANGGEGPPMPLSRASAIGVQKFRDGGARMILTSYGGTVIAEASSSTRVSMKRRIRVPLILNLTAALIQTSFNILRFAPSLFLLSLISHPQSLPQQRAIWLRTITAHLLNRRRTSRSLIAWPLSVAMQSNHSRFTLSSRRVRSLEPH